MLNGTGAGHRIDHDSNCVKYFSKFSLGTWSFCLGNQDSFIEGLWSFCFAKVLYMHTMARFWRQQVDCKPRGASVHCVCFHVLLSWIRSSYWLIWFLHTDPRSKHGIIESIKVREFKFYTITTWYREGVQIWIGDYFARN